MARNEEMERRLQNWARWRLGPRLGGLGYASVAAGMEPSAARYRQSVIPTNDCEAEETDEAVRQLPSVLRRTVEVFYLDVGGVDVRAAKLAIERQAVYARLARAHRTMEAHLAEAQLRRQAERRRVESALRQQGHN